MRLSLLPSLALSSTLSLAGAACSPPPAPPKLDPIVTAPTPSASPAMASPAPELQIDLERRADASWIAGYRLLGPATTKLTFARENNLFRKQHWRPIDPAFQLVDEDAHEVLTRIDGRPFSEAKLSIASQPTGLLKDYDPVYPYTDGSVLVFTGHYLACPATASKPVDPGKANSACIPTSFALRGRAGDRVIAGSRALTPGERWKSPDEEGTYLYVGAIAPVDTPRVVAVIDPGLPSWIGARLRSSLPRLFDYYASRTGVELRFKPSIFFNYVQSDVAGLGRQGGTLPGLIQFSITGKAWENETPEAIESIFQFLAHESAHLWNTQMFDDEGPSVWLHEGGADAFAYRALLDARLIDEKRFVALHSEALRKCLGGLEGIALRDSAAKRRFGNYYACGAVMQTMIEAAAKKKAPTHDLFTFWSSLFQAARKSDNRYTEAGAFALVAEITGEHETSDFLRAVVETPMADRVDRFRRELERLGLGGVAKMPSLDVERETGEQALHALMRQDCKGVSLTRHEDSIELQPLPACVVLKKNLFVTRIGPHSILTRGVAAHAYATSECRARGRVKLEDAHGAGVTLPCTAIPPREPVLVFDRVAYP